MPIKPSINVTSLGVPSAAKIVPTQKGEVAQFSRDPAALRAWWHRVLRLDAPQGQYPSYALFLVLGSDTEAVRYLTEHGRDLDQLSGDDCLVLALRDDAVMVSDAASEEPWITIANAQATEGHSAALARFFEIPYPDLPCLALFKDIRPSDYVGVSMKGMTAEKIGQEMRIVFAIVREAVSNKHDPIAAVARSQNIWKVMAIEQKVVGAAGQVAVKSIETAIEVLVKKAVAPVP